MGSNHHYQGFENNNSEIYNTMEMIGFPHNQTVRAGPGGPSSSKSIIGPQHTQHTHDYYHHDQPWLVEDQSLRCVFPSEGNEKPSQGLSLSLSSSNPSTMGFQSFELRQRQINEDMGFVPSSSRINGYFSKPLNIQPQEQIFEGENIQYSQDQFFMRNSKYIGAVQELLNEFCSLGIKENDHDSSKIKLQKGNILEENVSSSSKKQALYSLDLLELQKKKTKLLHLLEELDRRYKHYCEQMKTMKSSFEVIAGNGASKVYTTLASKAMSKHFRCLRDSIVEQIKIVKKGMGEKDSSSIGIPGTTKGETPRLRVLDQSLRQQRAFQQMTMMETHPWRPQRGLPERSVSVLRAWLFEHFLHPYPSDVDKHILARQTGLSRSQVSNWFINARVRLWKPMVEEMYVEELKEQEGNNSNNGDDHDNHNENLQLGIEDEKPTHDQLIRIDSECLSSVVNNQEKNDVRNRVSGFSSGGELDFSSYNHNSTSGVFGHENAFHGFGDVGGGNVGGGGGVSLTLGLQQHGETGVSLAFSSASQSSLFYPRDQEYSLLDNEGQNLPYRNLMGAQLLHDLTR